MGYLLQADIFNLSRLMLTFSIFFCAKDDLFIICCVCAPVRACVFFLFFYFLLFFFNERSFDLLDGCMNLPSVVFCCAGGFANDFFRV